MEVCVVAYRNEDTISRLVDSLSAIPDVALAVHDNHLGAASLDVAAREAAAAGIPFRGERCAAGNCGFGAGCNSLASSSAAHDLLFLNPDAAIVAWPAGLRASGRIVGPLVTDDDGAPTHVWGTRRTLRDEAMLRWGRRRPAMPRGTGYVSGAAMLVGRETFRTLGGFDEQFFMYYEDIELCRRANAAGVPVVLDESWVVTHAGGHSVGRSADSLTRAFLTSYESGRRFHRLAGHSVRGYDLLVTVDAAARAAAFRLLPGRRAAGVANGAVARVAARNVFREWGTRHS